MRYRELLILTAYLEAAVGLLLLAMPGVPLRLILGLERLAPETDLIARLAGAALLALGIAAWAGRSGRPDSDQRRLIVAVLIYDAAAAGLLAYAGLGLHLVGMALWPGVALHSALAIWCIVCLCC